MKKLFTVLLGALLLLSLFACDKNDTHKVPQISGYGTSGETTSEPEGSKEPVTSVSTQIGTFIPIGNGYFIDGYVQLNDDNTLIFHGRRFKIIDRKTVTAEEIEKINDSLYQNLKYYDEEGTVLFSWSSWGQSVGGTAPDEYRVERFEDFFTKKQEFSHGDYVAIPSYVLDGNEGFIYDSESFTYTYDEATKTVTVIGCNDLSSIVLGAAPVIVSGGKTIPECESFNGNAFELYIEALGL